MYVNTCVRGACVHAPSFSPFDSKIACLCQSIEINNNNNHVYRQSQVRTPIGSGVEWAECSLIIGTGYWVKVFAWSSMAQAVCQRAFSPLEIRFQIPWVRILHSVEKDNLCPFDLKIACLCQSVEINNNKQVCIYNGEINCDLVHLCKVPKHGRTETEIASSWWTFHHCLHQQLIFWQLPVWQVTKISLITSRGACDRIVTMMTFPFQWMYSLIIDLLHKSHNTLVTYPTMRYFVTEMCMCTCAHFCYKMVHCKIWHPCIVGFVR